ncbi:glycoside hydrolase family 18 protein [Haladaptatus sp. DFWS20]|uniref:glycoside hydrolase family 18 protein n=1 Tax=Haladaptatus sp. DFWS20 TaxID=3403467 RepID=UPI003EB838A5
MFSIQAGWYSGRFSDAALTAERRERFARTAIELVRTYNFDGIDIDWEYPDGTIRESDPHNLVLLLSEIRRQLDDAERADDQRYELSMAASANPSVIDSQEVGAFSDDVDFLNVMNYDLHGTWDERTHFNAPLYPVPDAPNAKPTFTADHAMRYWASQPIAKEKLHFGLPFYGRTFENVQNEHPSDHGLFNSFDSASSVTYDDIQQNLKPQSDYEYHWHPDAKVPWLYSAAEDTFVSYDNIDSIANKVDFVKSNGFGGAMCWELSQDPSNTLIGTMHDRLH